MASDRSVSSKRNRIANALGLTGDVARWDDLDPKDTQVADVYRKHLYAGSYLNQRTYPEDAADGVRQAPGTGLVLEGPHAETVAEAFLLDVCSDPEFIVRSGQPLRHWRGKPITDYGVQERGYILSIPVFCDWSKDSFEDPDLRRVYRSLFPSYRAAEYVCPMLLVLTDLELMHRTDWNTKELIRLIKSRKRASMPTLLTVSSMEALSGSVLADLADHFEFSDTLLEA